MRRLQKKCLFYDSIQNAFMVGRIFTQIICQMCFSDMFRGFHSMCFENVNVSCSMFLGRHYSLLCACPAYLFSFSDVWHIFYICNCSTASSWATGMGNNDSLSGFRRKVAGDPRSYTFLANI